MFISKQRLERILDRLEELERVATQHRREIDDLWRNQNHLITVVGPPQQQLMGVYAGRETFGTFNGISIWDRIEALPFKFKKIESVPAKVVAEEVKS